MKRKQTNNKNHLICDIKRKQLRKITHIDVDMTTRKYEYEQQSVLLKQ